MLTFFKRIRSSLLMDNQFRKYFYYAIGEIFLVVIGILIALQINNWNTKRIEQNNIKDFAYSFIQEIEANIDEVELRKAQITKINKRIDSLIKILNVAQTYPSLNIDIICLSWNLYYRPYKWNRSTLEQLKNSASLRHFKSESILEKIGSYDSETKHLEEDFIGDQFRVEKFEPFLQEVINFNYSNIKAIRKDLLPQISNHLNEDFGFFNHPEYLKAKEENLQVLTNSKNYFEKLINKLVIVQFQYDIRSNELSNFKKDATLLIELINEKYDFTNE